MWGFGLILAVVAGLIAAHAVVVGPHRLRGVLGIGAAFAAGAANVWLSLVRTC